MHATAVELAAANGVGVFGVINGTIGADTLDGTARGDQISGLDGDDVLSGLHGHDLLDGGAGNDQLFGGRGNDYLVGGSGNDTLDGGNGRDQVDYTADGPISGRLKGVLVTADGTDVLISIEGAQLGTGDDHIIGGHKGEIIYDYGGDNSFSMGKGDDVVRLYGDGSNTVNGGQGDDLIHAGAGADTLIGGLGFDTIIAGAGDDFIDATGGTLSGKGGADTSIGPNWGSVDGGTGFDTLDYSGTNHAVMVDLLLGTASGSGSGVGVEGIEHVIGTAFNDGIRAGPISSDLEGGDGLDDLTGGDGRDTLDGGGNRDKLTGGERSDEFVFGDVSDSTPNAVDEITDLSHGDVIRLDGIDADVTIDGDQAFVLVSALDGHAGQLALTHDAGQNATWLQGDVDGDGAADFLVRINGDHTGFTNFVL